MEDVRNRIDDEPAPKCYLTANFSEKPDEEFVCNEEYLTKYNGTSKSKRHKGTGQTYFNKVQTFFESHYDKREQYTEFLKGDCLHIDELTPRPYPDATQLPSYHYLKMKYTYPLRG